MRKSGVTDYRSLLETFLQGAIDRPVSFEVISDDLSEMEEQALKSPHGPITSMSRFLSPIPGESHQIASYEVWCPKA